MNVTMSYNSFKTYVCDHIHDYLPEKYREGSVKIVVVCKSNDQALDALLVEEPGCVTTPNIYLEKYYADYAAGRPAEQIMQEIAAFRMEFEKPEDYGVDPLLCKSGTLLKFEMIKDRIIPRLINYESSQTYLEDKAFRLIEDLAVTYHIYMEGRNSSYTAVITRDMLRGYHVSIEEMHKLAVNNMKNLLPIWFRALDTLVAEAARERGETEALKELGLDIPEAGEVSEDSTMVLSNETRCFGAAMILVPETMDQMGRILGKDFYIIPSSVHEVLIRPRVKTEDANAIRKVIREINRTVVEKAERLSDNVYIYDFKTHLPVICRD